MEEIIGANLGLLAVALVIIVTLAKAIRIVPQ